MMVVKVGHPGGQGELVMGIVPKVQGGEAAQAGRDATSVRLAAASSDRALAAYRLASPAGLRSLSTLDL